ncbi:hypothetical protein L6164_010701 [Bauhinia variegata]|uniref:Uncharacterized protein n=1 Tax=Bauhinia variegata TaxID=167791 RepID=A0ACB9P8R6_BAUVA|nr:hypothetical protein L6164_010701 [Bauhinia variegata]
MEEAMAARYWCHMCSQMINPIMEAEIKCPFCLSGFVEEMSSTTPTSDNDNNAEADFGSDRALSLWAPILLGMMGNPHRQRRIRRRHLGDDDDDDAHGNDDSEAHHSRETEYDRDLESIIRMRRGRSSANILQLLQGIRAGLASESYENSEGDDSNGERERERVILINPFNQTIIVQGSYDSNRGENDNHNPTGSFGDYFIGPGLDLLLQHLAENDPNRYGTPPAQKEAVEALPTVIINENLQCSVCLDDFQLGSEAKEMPCKHRFHSGCILPWLELHSSCPVCRFQLPMDESKRDSEASRNNSSNNQRNNDDVVLAQQGRVSSEEGEVEGRNASGVRRFSFPWLFNGLFSPSNASSSSSSNANGNCTQTDDN